MISETIRDHCNLLGISLSELARMTGQSPTNLLNKLKRDNLTIKQLQQIADVTNSELRVIILPKIPKKRG